jgi:hypothetical protein
MFDERDETDHASRITLNDRFDGAARFELYGTVP